MPTQTLKGALGVVPPDSDHPSAFVLHRRPARHVLVDDVGGDLQSHPSIRILPHVLPECRARHVEVLGRGDRVDQRRARPVPLPNRERVVVLAPGCKKTGQLRLQPVFFILQAVGVGAELPQAANDLVEQGAEHAPR